MTEGHCLISPLQHHCCATGLDEDVWSEIQVSPAEPRGGGRSPTVSGNLTVCASHNLLCAPLRRAQLFRRALVRMFESQDLDCVFMELHINPRQRRHMVLECVPLPRELGDMAPIYYKVSRRAASSPSDDIAPSNCEAVTQPFVWLPSESHHGVR